MCGNYHNPENLLLLMSRGTRVSVGTVWYQPTTD